LIFVDKARSAGSFITINRAFYFCVIKLKSTVNGNSFNRGIKRRFFALVYKRDFKSVGFDANV